MSIQKKEAEIRRRARQEKGRDIKKSCEHSEAVAFEKPEKRLHEKNRKNRRSAEGFTASSRWGIKRGISQYGSSCTLIRSHHKKEKKVSLLLG